MGLLKKTRADIADSMLASMRNQDAEGFTANLNEYGDRIIAEMQDQMALGQSAGSVSAEEVKFANSIKTMAAQMENGKTALSNTEVVMPQTIIDKVFENIVLKHPLLDIIDFQNTSYATKVQISKLAIQKALWGSFDAEVTKELEAAFEEVDMTLLSLTAFIPVSRGVIDLGPSWITSYVVTMLTEAIANGLEDGIINGLKQNEGPIGLMADLSTGAGDPGETQYTEKEAVKITKLDAKTYGDLVATLAETPDGIPRTVDKVAMIVNPKDYYKKIYPAITVHGAGGTYAFNSVPFATDFIQSAFIPEGKAILTIPNGYFMGLGNSGKAGQIEWSDEYRFLERKRYFLTYLYANGFPKDNNVSIVLDISDLKPLAITVETVSAQA